MSSDIAVGANVRRGRLAAGASGVLVRLRFAIALFALFALFALCAIVRVRAEPADWGPLAATWVKLPVACGRNLESTCGGDHFTLKPGVLEARRTCAGVQLVVRDHNESTWQVDVVGKKQCVWNARRVRSFVFALGPTANSLSLVAYSGPTASPGEELFQGHGFERN